MAKNTLSLINLPNNSFVNTNRSLALSEKGWVVKENQIGSYYSPGKCWISGVLRVTSPGVEIVSHHFIPVIVALVLLRLSTGPSFTSKAKRTGFCLRSLGCVGGPVPFLHLLRNALSF